MKFDSKTIFGRKRLRFSVPDVNKNVPFFNRWRPWFAWYPVKVDEQEWRWLERVERRDINYTVFDEKLRLTEYRSAGRDKP